MDHARTLTLAVADGAMPSSEGCIVDKLVSAEVLQRNRLTHTATRARIGSFALNQLRSMLGKAVGMCCAAFSGGLCDMAGRSCKLRLGFSASWLGPRHSDT